MAKASKGTTAIGYTNRNGQTVVRKTFKLSNDLFQVVYVLKCGQCKREYGANGSDIFQRRCPYCDPRARGLDLLKSN